MATSLITNFLGASSLCLGGLPIIGVGYINSRESFSKYIQGICLPEKTNIHSKGGDWKIAQDKLSSSSINSQEFKDLKAQLEKITNDDDQKKESGKHLRNLCTKTYRQIYKSWLFQNDLLLNDLKTFCSLKIKEKLKTSRLFDTEGASDKEKIQGKLTALTNHNADSEENGKLTKELEDLKNNSNIEDGWQKLRDWCKNTYEKPYLGDESNNELKLAKKYCQKR